MLPSIKPITLMGANASGKTELGVKLAKKIGGELVSADSKQIYKYLSAGTSKPRGQWTQTAGEKAYLVDGVPYHLVDTLDPRSSYDAGTFVKDAKSLLARISAAGKTPIIAGGTGMYIQALWNGLDQLPGADVSLRKTLAETARTKGKEALHSELAALDPKAAAMIPPGNIQRVMRALEITKLAGRPVSQLWSGSFFNALPVHLGKFVFIKWKKEILNERIKSRTAAVFDAWAEETAALLKRGYPEDAPGLKSLGYPQMLDFLSNKISRAEALHAIVMLSMAYAKRQNTWFARYKNALKLEFEVPADYDTELLSEKIIKC
ncbi:MAG: tRNA (adenosine(37)-N6)-dimethylallyltransferase MiaA [Elusimicrobia bacterium]|nr:tRNA (adenosine(37)-N6)-dimethylallyltransferase MiaA [Elusimicrobiota bacterium]